MKKIMNIIITVLLCFGMITINILPISAFNQSGVIVEKEIYLNLPVDDILQPRASVANDRWKVGEYKDTVRGLTMTANVTLRVTIMVNESTGIITSYRGLAVNTNWVRVNDATGVITSFSGPSVSLIWSNVGMYCIVNPHNVSTSYSWGSSTHRSITFNYRYALSVQDDGQTYISPTYEKTIRS